MMMPFSPLQSVAECLYAIGKWLKKSPRNKLLFALSLPLLLAASYAPPLHRHFTMGCMIAIALVLWALFSLFFGSVILWPVWIAYGSGKHNVKWRITLTLTLLGIAALWFLLVYGYLLFDFVQ